MSTNAVMTNLGKSGQAAQGLLSRWIVRAVFFMDAALLNASILLRHGNFQHSQPVNRILCREMRSLRRLPIGQQEAVLALKTSPPEFHRSASHVSQPSSGNMHRRQSSPSILASPTQ